MSSDDDFVGVTLGIWESIMGRRKGNDGSSHRSKSSAVLPFVSPMSDFATGNYGNEQRIGNGVDRAVADPVCRVAYNN